MKVRPTDLPEVLLLEPVTYEDARGSFMEIWREEQYVALGIPGPFVQDNLSRSCLGTLRGLHFQEPHSQGKLIQVLEGRIFDVAVDIRRGSPRFGQWTAIDLEGPRQLWVPEGFAHGFCVTSPAATVLYKCTASRAPEAEHVIAWNDPELRIRWPVDVPILSERDQRGLRLADAVP